MLQETAGTITWSPSEIIELFTYLSAAKIAKLADVNHLLLGHYSTRYGNIELFRTEANEIFENVLLADDGLEFEF